MPETKPVEVEIDFTGVEGRTGPRIRVPEGNYPLKVVGFKATKAKKSGNAMWEFPMQITAGPHAGKKITERCVLVPDALFRLRELIEACGYKVPPQKITIKPEKQIVGKTVGAFIRDGEPYGERNTIASEIGYYVPMEEVKAFPAWANEAPDGTGDDTLTPAAEDDDEIAGLEEDDEPDFPEEEELDEESDDEEDEPAEEEEEGYTEEGLEALERAEILAIAKEMGVKRTKGKHTGTYIKEILQVQAEMAAEELDDEEEEEEESEAGGDVEEFSLDDLE